MRNAAVALGLGLGLCLVAAAFAVPPLYLPGIALLLIATAATAWVSLAARSVGLVRTTGSLAVEEHADLAVSARVTRARVPLPGAEVRAFTGGPAVPLSEAIDGAVTAAARFPRRGRQELGPACALISDPLGLCRRTVCTDIDEVLVLPRIEPVRLTDVAGEMGVFGHRARSPVNAGTTDVDSLQPLRPGTPASRIHWPTVARTTTLMERRLVGDGERSPLIVIDPRRPSSPEALDRAIRAAASLSVHLARRGGCALLLPGDRRPARLDADLSGFSALHARLALLEPDAGAPPLACLSGADAVLWVTAAPSQSAQVAQVRAAVRYLISPHPRTGWPVEFTVAGCSGQRLERAGRPGRAAA